MMFVRYVGIVLLFHLVVGNASAQTSVDSVSNPRSEYVEEFKDYFFLWPVVKRRQLSFDVESATDRKKYVFQPNNAFTAGFGAYLFDLSFELTFAIKPNSNDQYTKGESSARDWQINALSKKWGADAYHQKYEGFYISGPGIDPPVGQPFPQRPDIATRNFGISGLFVFNDKKYSLKSAFNFAERQKKRGGSFILTGTLNSFKMTADSSILDDVQRQELQATSTVQDVKYVTLSIGPGYAYNYVYRDFFVSLALTVGPSHNWIYFKNEGQSPRNDIRISTAASFRMGIGYSGDRWFGGFNFVQQSRNAKFDDVPFVNSSTTFRLLVGYRFREFGILRKSVWDFPKELFTKRGSD